MYLRAHPFLVKIYIYLIILIDIGNGFWYNNFMIFEILLSVFLVGISLAMDAFAVSICNGMIYQDLDKKKTIFMPLVFGLFQAIMPILGFYLGLLFIDKIEAFDHWVAFALLLIIGGKMIFDAIKELRSPQTEITPKKFSIAEVLLQGVATSIDALAVGFSLNTILSGVEDVQLWAWVSVLIIGVVTFAISLGGVFIGKKVGKLFRKKASVAEIIGGVVLILIGVKIVLESYFA